jgi:hypothetical protein
MPEILLFDKTTRKSTNKIGIHYKMAAFWLLCHFVQKVLCPKVLKCKTKKNFSREWVRLLLVLPNVKINVNININATLLSINGGAR